MSKGEPRSAASQRAEKALRELLGEGYGAGVVVLSYRRPGASAEDVSFGQASAAKTEALRDFVHLASTLRQLADQLDAVVKDPQGSKLRGVRLDEKEA